MGGNVSLIGSLETYSFVVVNKAGAVSEDNLISVLQREGVGETSGRNIHNAVQIGKRCLGLEGSKLSTA